MLLPIGDAHAMSPGVLSAISMLMKLRRFIKKIVVSADKTKLLGAVLVGCAKEYSDLSTNDAEWSGCTGATGKPDHAGL